MDWPWVIVRLLGLELSVKSGVARRVDRQRDADRPGEAAADARDRDVGRAGGGARSGRDVQRRAAVAGFVAERALTPLGSALVESVTPLLKPPVGLTVTV